MERPTTLPERRSQTSTTSDTDRNVIIYSTPSINAYQLTDVSPDSKVQCRDNTNMTELGKRGTGDQWSLL